MVLLSLVLLPILGALILWWSAASGRLPALSERLWESGLVTLGLTALLWLVSRGGLNRPVSLLSEGHAALDLPAWRWQLTNDSWWLAGLWLGLVFVILLGRWRGRSGVPAAIALAGAGLFIVSADSAPAFMGALLLASLLWLALGYALNPAISGLSLGQRLLTWWLPLGLSGYLYLTATDLQPLVVALATLPLLGLAPWQSSRVAEWLSLTPLAPLLYGLPILAALRIFLNQVPFANLEGAAWLALWGAAALGAAAITAWTARDTVQGQVALLGCSGALVWLAGSFGGAAAALAEGRGLLVAGAALLLLPHSPARTPWTRIPRGLVAVTMAGLPLTAGGYGRALLFEGLLRADLPLAWVVVALLSMVPAALWFSWALEPAPVVRPEAEASTNPLSPILPWFFVLLLLPSARQITGLAQLALNSWLALLLPLITAAVLVYVQKERPGFGWNPPKMGESWALLQTQISEAGKLLRQSVGEAGRLLEGEGGLLWILFLAVLFGLARL